MHRQVKQRQARHGQTKHSQAMKLRFTAWIAGAAALAIALVLMPASGQVQASPSDIQLVVFSKGSGGSWSVDVTIRHPDPGWDHYTNVWVVETLEGKELGRRVLFHPHEDEQPFTRSHTVKIPLTNSGCNSRQPFRPSHFPNVRRFLSCAVPIP